MFRLNVCLHSYLSKPHSCSTLLYSPKLCPQLSPALCFSPNLACWHSVSFPIPYTSFHMLSPVSLTCSWLIEQHEAVPIMTGSDPTNSWFSNTLLASSASLAGKSQHKEDLGPPCIPYSSVLQSLLAAEPCKAFRKILLPNHLNLASGLKNY